MKNKLLGIGSFVFTLYIIFAIVVAFILSKNVDPAAQIPRNMLPFVVTGMILLFISVIGVWFFIIYDIVHIAKNQTLTGGAKAGWIFAIWFFNIFIIPVYWFLHLKDRGKNTL